MNKYILSITTNKAFISISFENLQEAIFSSIEYMLKVEYGKIELTFYKNGDYNNDYTLFNYRCFGDSKKKS